MRVHSVSTFLIATPMVSIRMIWLLVNQIYSRNWRIGKLNGAIRDHAGAVEWEIDVLALAKKK